MNRHGEIEKEGLREGRQAHLTCTVNTHLLLVHNQTPEHAHQDRYVWCGAVTGIKARLRPADNKTYSCGAL